MLMLDSGAEAYLLAGLGREQREHFVYLLGAEDQPAVDGKAPAFASFLRNRAGSKLSL